MPWQVYLSGEIHTDWRERIERGAAEAGLGVEAGPLADDPALELQHRGFRRGRRQAGRPGKIGDRHLFSGKGVRHLFRLFPA